MGLKDSGIAAEFGLVSLTVPRRLWKPKKVVAAKQRSVRTPCLRFTFTLAISVDATEAVRYPPPSPFIPVQTKGINKHIGLLRHYYHDRITKLALPAKLPTPPPPPTQEPAPPTPVAKEPTPPSAALAPVVPAFVFDPYNPSALAIGGSSATAVAWSPPSSAPPPPAPVAEEVPQPPAPVVPMGPPPALGPTPGVPPPIPAPLELPPTLEDDLPDPARVKVGPLGQIQQISASAALKQKRAAAKLAATGGSAAAIAAGLGSVSSLPKPAAKPKPKKPKEPKELKESKTTPKKANKKAGAAPPTPVAPTAS
jgi:transcriptional activator SPT7